MTGYFVQRIAGLILIAQSLIIYSLPCTAWRLWIPSLAVGLLLGLGPVGFRGE